MRRPRGGQISVQGRWRHAEPVGHVSNGNVGIGEQRPRYVEIVLGQLRRSAARTVHKLCRHEARARPLSNQGALELGERGKIRILAAWSCRLTR